MAMVSRGLVVVQVAEGGCGVAPPDDGAAVDGVTAAEREIAACADAFFFNGLKRWGHRDVVSPFRRGEDGKVTIRQVRGKRKTADYKPVELRAEVMDLLRAEKQSPGPRQVWWIMVYPGDPPARPAAAASITEPAVATSTKVRNWLNVIRNSILNSPTQRAGNTS